MEAGNLYRIGELAKLAKVSRRTVDFYTRLGLVSPEERSEGNYRLYGEEALQRLRYIQEMKKRKYTLEEIRDQLRALDRQESPSDLLQRVERIRQMMKDLENELSALRPQFDRCAAELREPPHRLAVQQAFSQGLSLAQTLLVLICESQWFNL